MTAVTLRPYYYYYLRRRLASGEGIVVPGVCVSVCRPSRDCTPQCRISLGGNGSALYPMLYGYYYYSYINKAAASNQSKKVRGVPWSPTKTAAVSYCAGGKAFKAQAATTGNAEGGTSRQRQLQRRETSQSRPGKWSLKWFVWCISVASAPMDE